MEMAVAISPSSKELYVVLLLSNQILQTADFVMVKKNLCVCCSTLPLNPVVMSTMVH
jgi:hypothetical protein